MKFMTNIKGDKMTKFTDDKMTKVINSLQKVAVLASIKINLTRVYLYFKTEQKQYLRIVLYFQCYSLRKQHVIIRRIACGSGVTGLQESVFRF